uniref:Growth factor receptor bound protein 10 n=1 Tax=Fundulus heteroclitus TaxID=8078 RepID=A0A3Q2QBV3_FUNHE
MAVAGCPDYFLHHPNYQDNIDCSSNHRQADLIRPSFQQSTNQSSPNHQEDDVDLEALVNDMNSSLESLYSTCSGQQTEITPLLHNGQSTSSPEPSSSSSSNVDPPQTKLRRSQPMHILAVRLVVSPDYVSRSHFPLLPTRFPSFLTSVCVILSPSCLTLLSTSSFFQIVKIFSEDGVGKVVEIPADMTVRDLCQLLVYKSHCVDDNSWALVEHHPLLGLERCLEDHELVVQVQASMSSESRFLFRKNYAKYEFFRNPLTFFPEHMVAWCQESNHTIPPSQLLQTFLSPSTCPEIQGYLYMKEVGRKSWKKLYMFLRRSGLYCSTKGTSKEPRHLQLLADLEDSSIFTVITGKKQHGAPTDYSFCIKVSERCLKSDNYKVPQQRKTFVSENSLVAMDFSGRIGRVIDNPVEAQSAAMEEGHVWRKRNRVNALGSHSPLHQSSLSSVIHITQLWFYGRITREESHRIIHQQGQVDGLFLLRVSQSNPKAFVLTLCHHQKIKHFQILPCEEDGQVFFSLDDGVTKFTDLIQLVEFYQLNRGVLPCKLKHPCTVVAL